MNPEPNGREWLLRCFFALLALVVPGLAGYTVYYQVRTPATDLTLDWRTGTATNVPPGSLADYAGFMAGDVILTVDGVPFAGWDDLRIENYMVEVRRRDQVITLEWPLVPVIKFNLLPTFSGVMVALVYWGSSLLLLVRRFRQSEIRRVFVLAQTLAVALLFPIVYSTPPWTIHLSVACLYLSAPLILHHYITFPVKLGAPGQRRWGLSLLYALALLSVVSWLSSNLLIQPLGVVYTVSVITAAIGAVIYVYLRRATPNDRRRLRLVFFSTLLAGIPPTLFYLVPTALGYPHRMPIWLVGLFVAIPPFGYLYATLRHNLFGIDRLLNRTLVYAILWLGILLLYLGPSLLIYRFAPGDWLAQMMIAAGLTLLVGLSFDWTRTRVQRLVDHLFYGGWYDYPGVVETISDALARCIERPQLTAALTRQVPALMQLRAGQLWIGKPGQSPHLQSFGYAQDKSPIPALHFPLSFQGQARGVWIVEPRRDGEDFSQADRRILNTLARQAETALGNVLLVETLRRQLEEIRASRETLAQAQRQLLRSREEERARLARDLHDGPIQALVGLNLQMGLHLSQAGETNPLVTATLKDMRAEVQALLSDLRQVCAELRPPMLDTLGLGAALRALAEDWSDQYGVATRLELPPDATLRSLPGEVAVNLYRVVQEALTNVARHAGASQVAISLAWEAPRLMLTIRDDGRGFVLPDASQELTAQGHFGLVGMQERVDLIGGRLAVESSPGHGATVRVTWQAPAS